MNDQATSASAEPNGLAQRVQDCIALRETRSVLVRSAHLTLEELGRIDGRLRAHLSELQAAGKAGALVADETLAKPGVGAAFTAAVLALRNDDAQRVAQLVALARTLPEARRGLVSALGWVPAKSLRQVASGWFATRTGSCAG